MSNVWFTSDLHLGHEKVSRIRGFYTTKDHDDAVCDVWSSMINTSDIVWVLGDVAVSNPTYAIERINKLPGVKHLISGNHDTCHPSNRRSHKEQLRYFNAFDSVQSAARQKWNNKEFLLSHFPYLRDRGETRYLQWRMRDEGEWLIHGHLHDNIQIFNRELHVGLDAWMLAPAHLDQILDLRGDN